MSLGTDGRGPVPRCGEDSATLTFNGFEERQVPTTFVGSRRRLFAVNSAGGQV
ncbi:MAG: hypothetical protein U1D30_02165 [Planctomycetota bacterium]